MLWQWAILVHIRNITGVSYCSDRSNAIFANRYASSESAGSSMGTLEATA